MADDPADESSNHAPGSCELVRYATANALSIVSKTLQLLELAPQKRRIARKKARLTAKEARSGRDQQ
jgi:hypothetical protein